MRAFLIYFGACLGMSAQPHSLTATLSSSPLVPSGTGQLALMLPVPVAIAHGSLTIDLDRAVFTSILAINVFSASGDQLGVTNIVGNHAEVQFTSGSDGVGRLPGLPVMGISAGIAPGASLGSVAHIGLQTGGSPWVDVSGNSYAMQFQYAGLNVGGTMSIGSVSPGGGTAPAGTIVTIAGVGFTAATQLRLDGVPWTGLRFVNPSQLQFTLTGSADLTGRHFVLTNADGSTCDYYSALKVTSTVSAGSGDFPLGSPIFPQVTYSSASGSSTGTFAIRNQTQATVDVAFIVEQQPGFFSAPTYSTTHISLPPAGVYITNSNDPPINFSGSRGSLFIVPSTPLQIVALNSDPHSLTLLGNGEYLASVAYSSPNSLTIPSLSPSSGVETSALNLIAPDNITPQMYTAVLSSSAVGSQSEMLYTAVAFTARAATDDGGSWLSVSSSTGATCSATVPCPTASVRITANPKGLSPGMHYGTADFFGTPDMAPLHLPVNFNVGKNSVIYYSGPIPNVGLSQSSATSDSITISNTGDPVDITATSNYLNLTPTTLKTPAVFKATGLNQAGATALASVSPNGQLPATFVSVQGPINSLRIPISVTANSLDLVEPSPAVFSIQQGSTTPMTQRLNVSNQLLPFTFSSTIVSGGTWLAVAPSGDAGIPGIHVTADPSALLAGTYRGTVTVTRSGGVSGSPIQVTVPVTLVIYAVPAPLPTLSPSSLQLISPAFFSPVASISGVGSADLVTQAVTVTTGATTLPYSVTWQSNDTYSWLSVAPISPSQFYTGFYEPVTPAAITVQADPTGLFPCVYTGSVIVNSPPGSGNSVTLPVTLTVSGAPPPASVPPLITALVNGASQLSEPVSPGEIVSIFGQGLGPSQVSGVHITSTNSVSSATYGYRVLFNGIAAPILYSSPTQVNTVVPYEVASGMTASLQVDANGLNSQAFDVPVAASAPGIFTQSGSGQGSGAVLNQDNSLNSSTNPAARGTIVQIFATGAGATNPAAITGSITGSSGAQATLPVSLTIGGAVATITSATEAPGAVSGLFQVNCVVPANSLTGAVPAVLKVGNGLSAPSVTIYVQ